MKNFDKNIKKKLYNAEMPVSEGMWESIEAQIPVKQDKPKYWMLFLVVLFALPFLLYPLSKGSNQNAEAIDKADPANITEIGQSLSSESASSSSIEPTASTSPKGNNSLLGQSTSLSTLDGQTSTTAPNNKRSKQSNQATIAFNNSTNYSFSSIERISTNSYDNVDDLIIIEDSDFPIGNQKKLKFLKRPINPETNLSNSVSNNFKLIEKSRIFQKANTIKSFASIGNLVHNFSLSSYDRHEDIGKMLGLKKASPICPSFKNFRSGIYLFSDFRIGLVNQQLENKTTNQETANIIAERNNSESGAISSSFNLGLGKKWDNGILLESGFNLDVITTNFRFFQPGGTIIVIDSFPEITMDTIATSARMVNSKNKFRQLNIPVNLGYEFPVSERLSIAAKAGILVNLSSSNSGQIFDNNGLISYNSSDRNNNLYKTNLGLSYTGGFDFIGEVTQNISGYVGLSVNYYPEDFSLRTYAISQSYYKYGMTAGLRYRL